MLHTTHYRNAEISMSGGTVCNQYLFTDALRSTYHITDSTGTLVSGGQRANTNSGTALTAAAYNYADTLQGDRPWRGKSDCA